MRLTPRLQGRSILKRTKKGGAAWTPPLEVFAAAD
jgi:hypothetical protein